MTVLAPKIEEVRHLQRRLREWLVYTPVIRCRSLEDRLAGDVEIHGKMEFLQQTGTFKPRGALSVMLQLDSEQLKAGVTAVSAGNHAIATAFAAQAVGTSAKVVMTKTASPVRMAACRSYGAEVVLADDVHVAFDMVDAIREQEGRYFVHPFEGREVERARQLWALRFASRLAISMRQSFPLAVADCAPASPALSSNLILIVRSLVLSPKVLIPCTGVS